MRNRRSVAALLSISLTAVASFPNATAAGRSSTPAVNTILNGKGVPKSALGIDGDFYIDTRSLLIYGPKSKGKWPTPKSLQGPVGPSGNDGRNGNDGKAISNSNVANSAGPPGPQGATGPAGAQGEKGEQGLPGAMGVAGSPGLPGSSGAAGINGSNGAQGPSGPNGATGIAGAKGETGTVGPSEVSVIDIPVITLGTSTPYSYGTSQNIGNLVANQNYKFEILLRASSNLVGLILGADLISSGSDLAFNYIRSDFQYATYSGNITSYGFVISGTVKVGSNNSTLQARVIDGRGETASSALNFSGKAYITLVGGIK